MKQYILYDKRAITQEPFDCTVLDMDESIKELERMAKCYGGGVIYSYDTAEDGKTLINEKFEKIVK